MLSARRIVLLGVVAGFAFLASGLGASAESFTWHFRSEHPNTISLEFYSQDRDHVWPGNNEVYVIDDDSVHHYTLECRRGEKICYGAWVRNRSQSYWGAGYDGVEACESCCYVCDGGETNTLVLER